VPGSKVTLQVLFLPHQFLCWSDPCCKLYSHSLTGQDVLLSQHVYFLKENVKDDQLYLGSDQHQAKSEFCTSGNCFHLCEITLISQQFWRCIDANHG
jgi:hypothetical protein